MASNVRKIKSNSDWQCVEDKVLAGFDQNQAAVRAAIKVWREELESVAEKFGECEVVHQLQAPEVIDAVIAYHKADIEENITIHLARIRQQKRRLAYQNLVAATVEFDGVVVDSDNDEVLVPELLQIIRQKKVDETEILKEIVSACVEVANSAAEERAEVAERSALKDFSQFKEDFLKLLDDEQEASAAVNNICENLDFAETVANDDHVIKPLRYLAQIVVKTRGANQLPRPTQARQIGFTVS